MVWSITIHAGEAQSAGVSASAGGSLGGGRGAVDWDTAASNRSTGNCLSNFKKGISSNNANFESWAWKTRIEKFELDEGFQQYHPAFRVSPGASATGLPRARARLRVDTRACRCERKRAPPRARGGARARLRGPPTPGAQMRGTLWWHYSSHAARLMRPHLFHACFVVSRITTICQSICHFWRMPTLDK